MNRKQKKVLTRIILTVALWALVFALKLPSYLLLIPYAVIGYDILRKAFKGVMNRQPFDENFLMAVATVGAIALGEFYEGVAVMLFYQVGELFQKLAVGKSRRNIASLLDIRPDYANLEAEDAVEKVYPDSVAVGSIITVFPGERVPIDGVVEDGFTTVNMSALTGESIPVDKGVGDEVLSGSINLSGIIKLKTIREFGQSAASRILELVENASSKKSRSESFISRFAAVYTPAVCISALALALGVPLLRLAIGLGADFSHWIYRALTFLVISCPCALVISVPLSFFACIGGAGASGILIKGSGFIETLSKPSVVVLDKTGTVTKGDFEVSEVLPCGMEKDELLRLASILASGSNHPVSRSIVRYAGAIEGVTVTDFQEISGMGISAVLSGHRVLLGNKRLMDKGGIEVSEAEASGTVTYLAVDGRLAGSILISDTIKPQSKSAVSELKAMGVYKTVMLTGDSDLAGRAVSQSIGIDEVHTRLMPEDKVRILEQIIKDRKKGSVVFAGDGINDAPSLTLADVGIAMGGIGSDAAIEAADVVIMDDNPLKISKAVRIAKKCMRIVYQNIYGSIGVKVLCLVLGALGVTGMQTAIFADVGIMVLAVANSVRCLKND